MIILAALADVVIGVLFLAIYSIAGVGVLSPYPDLRTLGMLLGVAFAIFMIMKFCNVSSFYRAFASQVSVADFKACAPVFVMGIKDSLPALGLSLAWMIGVMGIPVFNWLPLVFLIYLVAEKNVVAQPETKPGFKDWCVARALEIRNLDSCPVIWQVSVVAVVAHLIGHYIGSHTATAILFALAAPCAVNRLLIKNEVASLMRIKETIATGKLDSMESAYKALDKAKLPKSAKALEAALHPLRNAAALVLDLAALNPSTSYYASIFRAAAKNVIAGEYGVKFEFRELGIDPAIYRSLDSVFNYDYKEGIDPQILSQPRMSLDNLPGISRYFQSPAEYSQYDNGLKKILEVMNSLVGEDLFTESGSGLSVVVERGFFWKFRYTHVSEIIATGERVLIEPTAIRICLESKCDKPTGYVFVHRNMINAPELDKYKPIQKAAQDLAIFYSITLGIPYESLTTKHIVKSQNLVPAFLRKVKELAIEELKGQVKDAVIEAVAEKFFGDNAELVADLLSECMKDRAGEQLADLLADVIAGQIADAALGVLGELVSS